MWTLLCESQRRHLRLKQNVIKIETLLPQFYYHLLFLNSLDPVAGDVTLEADDLVGGDE